MLTLTESGAYLLWTFVAVAQVVPSLHSESTFVAAKVGDNVTLQCFYKGDVRLYWYKQPLGQKPRLVSSFYKYSPNTVFHHEFKNDSRFTLDNSRGENHLKIADLRVSDSAAYFCAKSYTFNFEFTEGTVVNVQGAGQTVWASVRQAPSETVQPGGSVTLNCTVHPGSCDGQRRVFWFKETEGRSVGLIYTARGGRCQRGSDAQTRTCVFSLPMKSLNRSQAGTYYCAIATCGHIVIGNGTRVGFEGEVNPDFLMFFWGAASALATLLSAVLAFSVLQVNRRERGPRQDSHANFLASYLKSGDGLCYVAAMEKRTDGTRGGMDNTWSECVYFGVKQ